MVEEGLWLKASHVAQMQVQVEACQPEEACGLLAGRDRRVELIYAVTNALHSPVRFRMEPAEQLRAFLEMEALGLELVAIYHSHPQGPPHPSPTDIEEAAYPEVAHLIWYQQDNRWHCRAFTIEQRCSRELPLNILE